MNWRKSNEHNLGVREDAQMKAQVEAMSARAFNGTAEQTCSHFGCGMLLTPEQKLYGSECTKHSGTPKETVSKFKGRQPTGKL